MPSCWEWSIIAFLIIAHFAFWWYLWFLSMESHHLARQDYLASVRGITADYTQLARNATESQRLMGQSIDALTHMIRVLIERQPSNGGRHVG
jgi:hypothetical protein